MGFLKTYRNSIWRVPLIAVISGYFYTPLHVSVMVRFGVTKSGEINYGVSLLTSAFLFLAVLFLGGITLLRKQTRKEIFVSAAVIFAYGILLLVIQLLTGSINRLCSNWIYVLIQTAGLDWIFYKPFHLFAARTWDCNGSYWVGGDFFRPSYSFYLVKSR